MDGTVSHGKTRDTTGRTYTIDDEGNVVGRNDPCPCGSGRKFKRCHGT